MAETEIPDVPEMTAEDARRMVQQRTQEAAALAVRAFAQVAPGLPPDDVAAILEKRVGLAKAAGEAAGTAVGLLVVARGTRLIPETEFRERMGALEQLGKG